MDEDKLQLELKKMQDEIISAVEAMISKSIRELEKYINNINQEKFDRINENVSRHDKYHTGHFEEFKTVNNKMSDFENKITESRNAIMKDVKEMMKDSKNDSKSNVSMFIAIGGFVLMVIWKVLEYALK